LSYDNLTKIKNKKFIFCYVFSLLKALYLTFIVKPKSFKGFINSFKGLGIYQILYNLIDENKHIRIFDEGLIHKIRALRRNIKNPDMINLISILSKYYKLPDMLIIIEANPNLIFERRIERNRKKDHFNYEAILDETMDYDFENAIMSLSKDIHKYGKHINIIRFENKDEEIVLDIVNKVVELIERNSDIAN